MPTIDSDPICNEYGLILGPEISAGEGEIFHGYRTYITMPTIDSEPIPTISLDLGGKLA